MSIPGVTVERQKKEMKWMLTLQTVYPYGLNDRVGDKYMAEKDSGAVANKSLQLHRQYKRPGIITRKSNLIILSENKILLKSLPHILIIT